MSNSKRRQWPALLLLCCAGAQGATLQVPARYDSIQDAIDAAADGDIIEVAIGTYRENLNLVSGIELRGVEAARTLLIAADDAQPVVTAADVDDVLLRNFTFTDSTAGISLLNSGDIIIASNVFAGLNGNAVLAGAGTDAEIINNVFWRNSVAIDRRVEDVDIVNNIFSENTSTITNGGLIVVDPDVNISFNCFQSSATAVGTNVQTGSPVFVDTAAQDFHLRQTSVCIDLGFGTDVIDNSAADMGAYGGQYADAKPYPVAILSATDASTSAPDVYNIALEWSANLAYLVTNDALPGSYNIWYELNQSVPPFLGDDAGAGQLPAPINIVAATSYTIPNLQPTAVTGTPVLLSVEPQNESVVLTWSAVSGATAYAIHYGATSVTENTLPLDSRTSVTVTGLQNDTQYVFAVSAFIQPVYYLAVTALDSTQNLNESSASTAASIPLGNPVEGALSNSLLAIPEVVVPYPLLPDEGCFIATAAFGADWAAEVQVLRNFRDSYLLPNESGRAFVRWYYQHGPVWAHWLNQHADWKPAVRALLWPLVVLAAFMLGSGAPVQLAVLLLGLLLVGYRVQLRFAGFLVERH